VRTCKFCGADFPWERAPGQRGRPALYCNNATCKNRSRKPRRKPSTRTAAERSESARKASLARWERVDAETRSAIARTLVPFRYTPEQIKRQAARRADLAARAAIPCPYCGDPVGKAGRVKCPKDDCNLSHNAARMIGYMGARRARKRGATVERVDALNVFERDNWMCGICDEPVDPILRHPDRMSVSLDHVVPLSLGGEHSYANTRCSHWICNVRRGNRVGTNEGIAS
jgi:hypothetical protein